MKHEPVILDGKVLSIQIRNIQKEKIRSHFSVKRNAPSLATILVGNNSASQTYVKMKSRACEEVGLGSFCIKLPENTTTDELLVEINKLNANPKIAGILLQHPVPKQIDERVAFDEISLKKDVDGVTTLGFGKVGLGIPTFTACTPAGILHLMDAYHIPLEGRHVVVVGRSPILGRPMAMLLLQRHATVTICHSRTQSLSNYIGIADIVIAACGKPRLIRGEWLKENTVVIDAGYNAGNIGDVDYDSCFEKASHITPVPGGVGPMTIAKLIENTVEAALSM